jgi:hypothetical protein
MPPPYFANCIHTAIILSFFKKEKLFSEKIEKNAMA